ncbi:MAG TPA: PorP/SprF family type IX secretion system membrane protein [Cryomorphaceae bacterium]|nr:PorP/SprF family type IX secretion system membrane protein [Cryomorphaceae bacterium]
MRKTALTFAFFTALLTAHAQQDFHYSQFFASPITYNPANSGAFEDDIRGALNYRNQYGSIAEPYRTFGLSVDAPIKISNDAYDQNFLGVGLTVVNDNAGTIDFNQLHIAGSAAYAIDLGGTEQNPHYISLGLQVAFIQRSMNFTNSTWETQWTGTNFNQSVSSGEAYVGELTEANVSLGGGISWFNAFSDNARILAGAAVLNANTPSMELLGQQNDLLRKYTAHVSMAIAPETQSVTYYPNLFVMFQGPNRIIDIGSEVEFSLWDRTEFTDFRNNLSTNLGAYYRYQDAIYFIGRINYYDLSLGVSYDFTASQLSENNNGQGGVELVIGYRTTFNGPGTNRQKLIRSKGL